MKKRKARDPSVSSSGYDPETRRLSVTFRGDRQYFYEDIDPELAEDFRTAPSQGKFLHRHIIGKFDVVNAPPVEPDRRDDEADQIGD